MNATVAANAPPALDALVRGLDAHQEGTGWKACCPAHADPKPSLSIGVGRDGKLVVHCFGGCAQLAVIDALRRRGLWPEKPATAASATNGRAASQARVKGYEYRDAGGALIAVHNRRDLPDGSKTFAWLRPDGQPSRNWQVKPAALPLYGLADLLAADAGKPVFLVEGEKACDALTAHGLAAVSLAGGAAQTDFGTSLLPLKGRRVVLWADNDEQGRGLMRRLQARLAGLAAEVRWLDVRGLPPKGDAHDFFAAGRTVDELHALLSAARALVVEGAPADTPPLASEPPATATISTAALAAKILAAVHVAQDAGSKLYAFTDGAYRADGERVVKRHVRETLEGLGLARLWTSHRAEEVCEYLRTVVPLLWERPPLDALNVENGLLDVASHALRPHDPAFLSPVQLPIRFDPSATCPAWERFTAEVFPDDAANAGVAWELAAWLALPATKHQKAVILLGDGSNGKSTFLRALTAFLGGANISNVTLHKLEEDRFSSARLVGRLANICPDLPSHHLTSTSTFKTIVGGDAISAEYKFRPSFDFTPFARLVFSANQPPRSQDASYAFFRRWLAIPFERTFAAAGEADQHDAGDVRVRADADDLDACLADPHELSGVLNRALDALPRIRAHGLTETPSMRAAWAEFRASTDPFAVWLDRAAIDAPDAVVPKKVLAAAYANDCNQAGRPVLTANAFARAFHRLRPRITDAQRVVSGRLEWCWVGIGLAMPPEDDERVDQEEGPAETPANPSRHSRHSRHSPLLYLSRASAGNEGKGGAQSRADKDKGIAVNAVNAVNAEIPAAPLLNGANRHGGGDDDAEEAVWTA